MYAIVTRVLDLCKNKKSYLYFETRFFIVWGFTILQMFKRKESICLSVKMTPIRLDQDSPFILLRVTFLRLWAKNLKSYLFFLKNTQVIHLAQIHWNFIDILFGYWNILVLKFSFFSCVRYLMNHICPFLAKNR